MLSPLKWHGGKSQLAKKFVLYEPKGYRIFGDCCVGGGSFLCVKDRPGVSEFANDLDGELTNFFRVLQDDSLYPKLLHRLEHTPFSQMEFDYSLTPLVPDLDRAWAFFVRNRQSRQAMGKEFATRTHRTRRGRNENASAWLSAIDRLAEFRDRVRWVEIRQMDCVDFIRLIDSPATLYYCDPPYLAETRVAGQYTVEMDRPKHIQLLDTLAEIEGKFMLSGYDSEIYQQYEKRYGWRRIEFPVRKSSSGQKTKPTATEILWLNYDP